MKYRVTLTPEVASILKELHENGDLKGIGVTNITEVGQPKDNSWKIDSEGNATPEWKDTVEGFFKVGTIYRARIREIILHTVYVSVRYRQFLIRGFIDIPESMMSVLATDHFKVGKLIRVKVIGYFWDY